MPINSRQKGKRAELKLAHILQDFGYEARRGQQYSGANGDADVVGVPGLHIEVKDVEHLNIFHAMEQSISDAKEGEIPTVHHTKNYKPWLVTLLLPDFYEIYDKALKWDKEHDKYELYQALGGNGTAEKMMQDIKDLPFSD